MCLGGVGGWPVCCVSAQEEVRLRSASAGPVYGSGMSQQTTTRARRRIIQNIRVNTNKMCSKGQHKDGPVLTALVYDFHRGWLKCLDVGKFSCCKFVPITLNI